MTTQELIKKYTTYRDNVQWHIDTNKPDGEELLSCQMRINHSNEIIKDLESLQEDNDNFTISFYVWASCDPQAKAYQEAGITPNKLLELYRNRVLLLTIQTPNYNE